MNTEKTYYNGGVIEPGYCNYDWIIPEYADASIDCCGIDVYAQGNEKTIEECKEAIDMFYKDERTKKKNSSSGNRSKIRR